MRTTVSIVQTDISACPDCGAVVEIKNIRDGYSLSCPRCKVILAESKKDSINRTFAFSFTGLMFFFPACVLPILELNILGLTGECTMVRGVVQIFENGFIGLAGLVLLCSILIPCIVFSLLLFIAISVKLSFYTGFLIRALKFYQHLKQWAMLDVYMLGVIIAFIKMRDLGEISVDLGFYCFSGVLVCGLISTLVFDPKLVWAKIDSAVSDSVEKPRQGEPVLCRTCRKLCYNDLPDFCLRCNSRLFKRKPESISRTWALIVTGFLLLIPANICPITYLIYHGAGKSDTILSGISGLIRDDLIPIAILVFVASIIVPLVKLMGLSLLLLSIHFKWKLNKYQCTLLYRFISLIGRWSMLDLFMLSILAALIDMGRLSSFIPGIGATAFASVVVVSMLAVLAYDPRLLWDLEEDKNG